MPTSPISPGTVNFTVNILKAERKLLGRIACRRGKSASYVARQLLLRGLMEDSPADAALLIRIREGRSK